MSTYNPAYAKRWRYDRDRGITRMTDSHQTRMHIASLLGAGWSQRAIAGAAGLSPAVVNRLATGGQTQVRRIVAAQILAVEPDSLPRRPSRQTTEPFVSRVGAVRRIQALMRIGWTHEAMRDHCGLRTALVLSQQGRWVTRTSHERIAAMYRDLSMRPGPSERTRRRAQKLGYHGPMAWDDIDHDETPDSHNDEQPSEIDEVAVIRRMAGDKNVRLSPAEQIELVRRWRGAGRPANECERLTGINVRRIERTAA